MRGHLVGSEGWEGARGTVSWACGRCLLIPHLSIHSFSKNGLSAYNGLSRGNTDSCPQEFLPSILVGDKISKCNSPLEDDTYRVEGLGLLGTGGG